MLLRDRNGSGVNDTGSRVTGVVDNIWRTMLLIKPKERRVLSFWAAMVASWRWHCIVQKPRGRPVIPVTGKRGREKGARPHGMCSREEIRAHSVPFARARLDPACFAVAKTGKTDVTRSSARIARGRNETPLSPSLAVAFSASPSTHV